MNRKEELLKLNIITSLFFIGTILISCILSYNDIKRIHNNEFINKKDSKNINISNRVLALILLIIFGYINYTSYKEEQMTKTIVSGTKTQLIASGLTIISAILVLYVAITANDNQDINIENPDI